MKILVKFYCELLLFFMWSECSLASFIISFQSRNNLSTDEWAEYLDEIPSMNEFTSCWWEKLRFFATDLSAVWGYCKQKSKTDQGIKCTQFYHRGIKSTLNRHIYMYGWLDGKSEVRVEIPNYFHRTWSHFCWQYSSFTGYSTFYYNGKIVGTAHTIERPSIGSDDVLPEALILGQEQDTIKGLYDLSQMFNGEISEFNIWNRILDNDTISNLSRCKSFKKGNVVRWEKEKFSINRAVTLDVSNPFMFCSRTQTYALFPQVESLENAKTICNVHGGSLASPKNEKENDAILKILTLHGSRCLQFQSARQQNKAIWLGFQRLDDNWHIAHDDDIVGLAPYGKWDPFTPVYPNLGCTFLQPDGFWSFRDKTSCNEMELCTICEFDSVPIFTLKGELCNEFVPYDYNYYFTINSSYQIHEYVGYKTTSILEENGSWNMLSECGLISLETSGNPIGRRNWMWQNRHCDVYEPTERIISLSICEFGTEFTCRSGRCIPITKRCDKVSDCKDGSDEDDCMLVQIPHGYEKVEAPSMSQHVENEVVPVRTKMIIHKIDVINTVNMIVGLTVEIKMQWSDNRLTFANLNWESQNPVAEEITNRLWLPLDNLIHENAVIGKIYKDNIRRVSVIPKENPVPLDGFVVNEEYLYNGTSTLLESEQRFRIEYNCVFELQKFPFDKQTCKFISKIILERNNSLALVKNDPSIAYNGESKMDQFRIGLLETDTFNNENETRFVVTMYMARLYNDQMINAFMPTCLMWLLCYSTLFIGIEDFNDRFMGAVTSLLVLAALLSSISNTLPQTSYFKYIDLWFLWYLGFIFSMVLYHIIFAIDRSQNNLSNTELIRESMTATAKSSDVQEVLPLGISASIDQRLHVGQRNNTNRIAIIVFPIIFLSFNVVYFILTT